MKTEITIDAVLQIIAGLLNRTPLTPAEQLGANAAMQRLQDLNTAHQELLAKSAPKPDAVSPNPAG